MQLVDLAQLMEGAHNDGYVTLTGKYDHRGRAIESECGDDPLALFMLREVLHTFDAALPERDQLDEACRVLRRGVETLERVIAALEGASTDVPRPGAGGGILAAGGTQRYADGIQVGEAGRVVGARGSDRSPCGPGRAPGSP